MKRTGALGLGVAIVLALPAGLAAQDQAPYPPFPPEHPENETVPGLWFQRPNVGYGPLHYVSLAPMPSLRTGFETQFPESMPAGKFDLRVTESWVKNLALSDQFQLDFEVLRSNINFTWALSDDVRLDLAIESASRTGGTLDAFILGFHQAFGLAIGDRDHFARNDNRIVIQPPGGGPPIIVDENDPQPYEQAALVTLRHNLTYGDEYFPAVAWSMTIRGNVAPGDVHRSGPLDLGASIGLVKEIETVHIYVGANLAWFGSEDFFGLKLRPIQWSTTVAFEWHLVTEFSIIAQYLVTSGSGVGVPDFRLPSHEIVAGFKWEPWQGVLIEISIVENIINPYNSPDFGVHGGVTFRW